MKARISKYTLNFKQPAKTSRGVLRQKETYFLVILNDDQYGVGEINLFRGLSCDDRPGFEDKLNWLIEHVNRKPSEIMQELQEWPSILFGYEMALRSFHSLDPFVLFPSMFTEGQDSIPINGLVWMGDHEFMINQMEEKLEAGFDCIKIKVGAIEFDQEIDLLKRLRSRFRESELTIRLDANGAFTPDNAMQKLNRLAEYGIHSIEQPIKAGQWDEMSVLCVNSPISIALDEELIGLFNRQQKVECLETIRPQYIILKPALVGGFQSSREWIDLASSINIDWWVTSALESNVGLNAIAQFTYTLGSELPQGLGTGSLYTNNISSPLTIQNGTLSCNNDLNWDTNFLNF